jgi:hypothetical protein
MWWAQKLATEMAAKWAVKKAKALAPQWALATASEKALRRELQWAER